MEQYAHAWKKEEKFITKSILNFPSYLTAVNTKGGSAVKIFSPHSSLL